MKNIYISKEFDSHDDLCDCLTNNDIPYGNIVSILWNGKFTLIIRSVYKEN